MLEETFKIIRSNHQSSTTLITPQLYTLSTTSRYFLNAFRDNDSTTSLGNLFQCLTTLSTKINFLISNLNCPGAILGHFLSSFHLRHSKETISHLATTSFQVIKIDMVSPESSFLQTEQLQLSQCLLGHFLGPLPAFLPFPGHTMKIFYILI